MAPVITQRNAISGGHIRAMMKERLPATLLARLTEVGRLADKFGVAAFVVGGLVRDLLLNRPTLDVDVTVEGDGMAFARFVADESGAGLKIFERFETAVVTFPDRSKLDLATARRESYERPAALPTVERGSIKEDLHRRDFTINALAIRLNSGSFGELIDFYGGQRDLHGKTIRVLHSRSFVEDPTRLFRAVRFECRFVFHQDRETLALLKDAAAKDLVHHLSGHRLRQEIVLLLSEQEPRRTVARLGELDLLRFIHPSLTWSTELAALLARVESTLDRYRDLFHNHSMDQWLVPFMALMDMIPEKAVEEALTRLAVRPRQAEAIRAGRSSADRILRRLASRPAAKPGETYRLLSGLPDETLLFLVARSKTDSMTRRLTAYVTTYRNVRPLVGGTDLKALGLKPGPRFKQILDRLLEARLNGEIKTKAEERALAKKLVKA